MEIRGELPSLTRYTFGSMSLGHGDDAADVKVARAAMDAGVWFHSSADYAGGGTYRVLKKAFAEDRAHVPKLMIKMDSNVPQKTRGVVETTLRELGVQRLDIAQMCWNTELGLIRQARGENKERWQAFGDLKQKGLVGSFVLEIWPNAPSCQNGIEALQDDLVDGYIFYYNLTERFVSNPLLELMEQRKAKILALRTLGGGQKSPKPGEAPDPKWQALQPIFAKSGCKDWLEFSMRFILASPGVLTTICGTRNGEHLRALLAAEKSYRPLDAAAVDAVRALHRQWAQAS
jgi:aryl-alcohol dehydrogenase-like predicted oxidoreductase